MSQLKFEDDIERIYLPSTEELEDGDPAKDWVDMAVNPLTAGDIVKLSEDDTEIEASLKMLVERIKQWSYTDASGAPVPIKFETVKKLDMNDYKHLMERLTGSMQVADVLTEDQKKT